MVVLMLLLVLLVLITPGDVGAVRTTGTVVVPIGAHYRGD
jgi:hypothetical protein